MFFFKYTFRYVLENLGQGLVHDCIEPIQGLKYKIFRFSLVHWTVEMALSVPLQLSPISS